MVYILYLVLDFYIFYFILANRLASPFYSVSKDQINFYLSSIRSCSFAAAAPNASSRPHVVVRRLFVPAKCVRFMKICKTHDKCYYYYDIYFEHAPVFLCPHCPLKLSSEKKTTTF